MTTKVVAESSKFVELYPLLINKKHFSNYFTMNNVATAIKSPLRYQSVVYIWVAVSCSFRCRFEV